MSGLTVTGHGFTLENITNLLPMTDNVWIAKDPNEWVSPGGIIIPDAHQDYKRRGWCIVRGGGFTTEDGVVQRHPFKPGDYLICDRHFQRPDETEDELTHENEGKEVTCIIRGDEVCAFVAPKFRPYGESKIEVEYKPPPPWVKKLIKRFSKDDE